MRSYPVAGNQICLFVGPYISYLMTAKLLKNMGSGRNEELDLLDLKAIRRREELNKFDIGILTGLDYEFAMGLILGFNFTIGLKSIIKDEESNNFGMENFGMKLDFAYNLAKLLQ